VRDDRGYWSQVETYIEQHSNAQFTHGLCPECARRLYPEIYKKGMPPAEQEEGMEARDIAEEPGGEQVEGEQGAAFRKADR